VQRPALLQSEIEEACQPFGLVVLGAFVPEPQDQVPSPGAAVVLLGNAGPTLWRAFLAAGRQKTPSPLDRWLCEILSPIAVRLGASVLFPFDGPPFLPFLAWAFRAGAAFPSPLGLAIHPTYGLWHAYRAALVLPRPLRQPAPEIASHTSPCVACADRPCLRACPVDAFDGSTFASARCQRRLITPLGTDCLTGGYRARYACPIGREHRYDPEQIAFHMRAQQAMMGLIEPAGTDRDNSPQTRSAMSSL
jgi:ferredoxin